MGLFPTSCIYSASLPVHVELKSICPTPFVALKSFMGAWLSEDESPEKLPRRKFLGLLVAPAVASWVPPAALLLRREDRYSDSRRLMRFCLLLLVWATASRAEFI